MIGLPSESFANVDLVPAGALVLVPNTRAAHNMCLLSLYLFNFALTQALSSFISGELV